MTCEKTTEQLIDWLEGELSPDLAAAVDQHVKNCAACAHEVAEIRQCLEAVTHPATDPGETYFASFFPRLREGLEAARTPWWKRLADRLWAPAWWPRAAAVAALLVLVVVGAQVATHGVDTPGGAPALSAKLHGPALARLSRNAMLARLDPAMRQELETLQGEEVEALKVQVAKMLAGTLVNAHLVVLPGSAVSQPVIETPSVADLDDAELTEVAEILTKDVKKLSL
jgi:hypothetical protein